MKLFFPTLVLATLAAIGAANAQAQATSIPNGEGRPDVPETRPSALSRSEVRAATLGALARGEIGRGESPVLPVEAFVAAKTRAEVRAETRVAMFLGLIPHGEAPLRDATPSELELIRLAGMRARGDALRTAGR